MVPLLSWSDHCNKWGKWDTSERVTGNILQRPVSDSALKRERGAIMIIFNVSCSCNGRRDYTEIYCRTSCQKLILTINGLCEACNLVKMKSLWWIKLPKYIYNLEPLLAKMYRSAAVRMVSSSLNWSFAQLGQSSETETLLQTLKVIYSLEEVMQGESESSEALTT